MTDLTTPVSARGSRYISIAKLVFAILLAVFVISRTNLTHLRIVIERLSLWETLLYLGLFVLITLVKAFQYHIVIGKDVAYPHVLNVVVMQNLVSNFLAVSAGIASYLSLFKLEHGVKVSRAMVTFVLTKVGDLIAISCLMVISLSLVWSQIGILQGLVFVLLAGMVGIILLFFLIVILRQRFVALLRVFLERLNLLKYGPINKGVDIMEALADQDRKSIIDKMTAVIAGSFLYLIVTLAWLYTGLRIFDIQLGLGGFAFSSALYYIISYIPIQIFGGLGVTETSLFYLYGIFMSSQAELAAILIGLRILNSIMNLVVLLYLPLYRMIWKDSGNVK